MEKRKKKPERYFDNTVEEHEVLKVKMKPKGEQKFDGEVIKVDIKVEGSQKWRKGKMKGQFGATLTKPAKSKIPKEKLAKYARGEAVQSKGVKTRFFKEQQKRKEYHLEYASEQAVRTELLLQEDCAFIEPDEEEITADYRQEEIAKNVDILSASKFFNLNLDFGPYTMRYTPNGRHLLLGGHRGHVAAFDWVTKKLICEMNVMEQVSDVSWLHVNTLFACAQKNWVHIYDHQGTELHCVKRMFRVNRMEFLPYHFLLATASSEGYLSWLDVSIGELVGNFNTRLGDIRNMCQNPGNGVLCVGGGKGVVSMWSPKVRQPLAKMLCHSTPISALTVEPRGLHLVTAGLDRRVKVWDVRMLTGGEPLTSYVLPMAANQVSVSQRGVLAFAQGTNLEMYNNLLMGATAAKAPYLRQRLHAPVTCMRFCPYEDILGVATNSGFNSLLVPGSGEPNFDAFENNPFQTKSQRREHEVHALLEKIPVELIALDSTQIAGVDEPTLQEKIDAKNALFHLKPPQLVLKSRRNKMKGRGGTVNASRSKQIVKDQQRKEFIQEVRQAKSHIFAAHREELEAATPEAPTKPTVLDRFKPKRAKIEK